MIYDIDTVYPWFHIILVNRGVQAGFYWHEGVPIRDRLVLEGVLRCDFKTENDIRWHVKNIFSEDVDFEPVYDGKYRLFGHYALKLKNTKDRKGKRKIFLGTVRFA